MYLKILLVIGIYFFLTAAYFIFVGIPSHSCLKKNADIFVRSVFACKCIAHAVRVERRIRESVKQIMLVCVDSAVVIVGVKPSNIEICPEFVVLSGIVYALLNKKTSARCVFRPVKAVRASCLELKLTYIQRALKSGCMKPIGCKNLFVFFFFLFFFTSFSSVSCRQTETACWLPCCERIYVCSVR